MGVRFDEAYRKLLTDSEGYNERVESIYNHVPNVYMAGACVRYIEFGVDPGDFMLALFSNDLKGCYLHADNMNKDRLEQWVIWMFNRVPSPAQGSREIVATWRGRGGMQHYQPRETE